MINTTPLTFHYSEDATGYYSLLTGAYSRVEIQIWWAGVNDVDSFAKICFRHNSTARWSEDFKLAKQITQTPDSFTFSLTDNLSGEIGIYINKGSVTLGCLTVNILAY